MTARDVTRARQNGNNDLEVEDASGYQNRAIVICGVQADGTVTPILVDSDGKVITTT